MPARSPHSERCTEPHGGGDASPGASRKVLQSHYPSQCPSCCGDQSGESRGATLVPLLSSRGPTCAISESVTCEERDTKMRTKPQFSPFSAENPAVGHRPGNLQGQGCPPEYRQPALPSTSRAWQVPEPEHERSGHLQKAPSYIYPSCFLQKENQFDNKSKYRVRTGRNTATPCEAWLNRGREVFALSPPRTLSRWGPGLSSFFCPKRSLEADVKQAPVNTPG